MTPTVKLNFKNDIHFRKENYKCWICPNLDSQAHIQICDGYEKFRRGKDLSKEEDLVSFFQLVISERQASKEQEGEKNS